MIEVDRYKIKNYLQLWFRFGPLVRIPWRVWIPLNIALFGIAVIEYYAHPLLNLLLILYVLLGHNIGLAIVTLGILVRILTLPVTLRQIRNNRRVLQLQITSSTDEPNPQETTILHGWPLSANPWVAVGPMLLHLSIWGAINIAILNSISTSPGALAERASSLYKWLPAVHSVGLIETGFGWLDLSYPDPSPFMLPLVIYVGMVLAIVLSRVRVHWAVKWLIPVVFSIPSLNYPSGIVLYWTTSILIGLGITALAKRN